ncbi:transposase [bacterium]|nr:transposase [bacterium]
MRSRHQQLAFEHSIHFITTVTRIRGNWFLHRNICRELLELFEWYRAKFEIDCLGYVLMPDHLHVLLFQEKEGEVVPPMMRDFKKLSSHKIHPAGYNGNTLWRDNYDDVPVPGMNAIVTKLEYMHHNPIRRNLVQSAEEYLWSSARDYAEISSGIVKIRRI